MSLEAARSITSAYANFVKDMLKYTGDYALVGKNSVPSELIQARARLLHDEMNNILNSKESLLNAIDPIPDDPQHYEDTNR